MSLHCHDQIPNKKIRFECQGSLLVLHSVSAPHRNMNLFRYKKLECGQTLNNSGRHLVLPGLLL